MVDKAYLIWSWRTFQKKYAKLRTLRHCFLKVLIIALSTIFVPNIPGYIRKFFYLHTLTHFYKQPLDRPNITQMVNSIITSGFKDLDFLILKTGLIPKTMVFVIK